MKDRPQLFDFIGVEAPSEAVVDKLKNIEDANCLYNEHLPLPDMDAAVRKGELVRGKYRVNRNNLNEGLITTNFGFEIKVVGKADNNRAIMGDFVAVKLHDEAKWLSNLHVNLQDDDATEGETRSNITIEDKKYASMRDRILKENLCPTGSVVGILRRDLRNLAGQISRLLLKAESKYFVLVDPVDPRFPSTILAVTDFDSLKDKKIVFCVDSWPDGIGYPIGHLVSIFGKADDMDTESKVILFEHNVETRTFSKAVLDCLPQEGDKYKISDQEIKKRQDLRTYPIVPCRYPVLSGPARLQRHRRRPAQPHTAQRQHRARRPHRRRISLRQAGHPDRQRSSLQVDHRVPRGPEDGHAAGPLDREPLLAAGRRRAAGLQCSLGDEPEHRRGTRGSPQILKTKFHKSVIKSKRAFTYKDAQDVIDDPKEKSDVALSLRGLMKMAKILKHRRVMKGALQLASTQVKFKFEEETHNPTDVSFYDLLDTNSMVEEFMLLANISVAQKTLDHFPGKSVLRRHSTPKPQMIKDFSALLHSLGYTLDYSSSRALAMSLDNIVRKDDEFFNKLIRILTTRCMNEATYICTADFDYPEYFHYGLAAEVYTHFTSPIRRYADILVHRLLAASLDIDSLPQSMCNKHNLTKICDNMNMRHRNARFASRASSDYYSFVFFKDKQLAEEAVISGIEMNGVSVILPKYGFEGFAAFSEEDEAENRKSIEADGLKIVTSCKIEGKSYRIFDRVNVILSMKMKHFRKQIDIKLAGVKAAATS